VPLKEAMEVFAKAGQSQISGLTDHPYIRTARGIEGFIYDWLSAHYRGDISFLREMNKNSEMRPFPQELRIYHKVPKLHMIPTVEGEIMYPDVPSLEETIVKISGTNYWIDSEEGLDTRQTIEKIKNKRKWSSEGTTKLSHSGKITGKVCDECGNLMINDGSCWKCMYCKITTGGCGGG
jgi:hypothetical protein